MMTLDGMIQYATQQLQAKMPALTTAPGIVTSPYRISPVGAHVDHQGGAVLGRTIALYTVLAFVKNEASAEITLHCAADLSTEPTSTFQPGILEPQPGWQRYAQAAAAALHQAYPIRHGIHGYVLGSLPGAGLSSSASVILAYLHALAAANDISLKKPEAVELARIVENEFLGLNNGIQDQTAITFGRADGLVHMNVTERINTHIADPTSADDVCFMLAWSGFSRGLLGSGFNTRVAECREAAKLLDDSAEILCDVSPARRDEATLAELPDMLARRARHVLREVERVEAGRAAWLGGDWAEFGRIMNASCHSSITQYESGSQPLVDLHEIALATPGIYGSRFSGGGYGGCLIMLADRSQADEIAAIMLPAYLKKYPEKAHTASVFIVEPEEGVRINGAV